MIETEKLKFTLTEDQQKFLKFGHFIKSKDGDEYYNIPMWFKKIKDSDEFEILSFWELAEGIRDIYLGRDVILGKCKVNGLIPKEFVELANKFNIKLTYE